jgi:hypothetical protein
MYFVYLDTGYASEATTGEEAKAYFLEQLQRDNLEFVLEEENYD